MPQLISFFAFVHQNVLHWLPIASWTASTYLYPIGNSSKTTFNTMVHTSTCVSIAHRNHIFHLYNHNRCWETKATFRPASNWCSRVIKSAKEGDAELVKEKIRNERIGSRKFLGRINRILNRGKSPIPIIANGPEFPSSSAVKAFLFGKLFAGNSSLDDSYHLLPGFPMRRTHHPSISKSLREKSEISFSILNHLKLLVLITTQ